MFRLEVPVSDGLDAAATISGMAIGAAQDGRAAARRPFGVRLYLALAFAAVALITAGLAYLLVSDSSEQAADERAERDRRRAHGAPRRPDRRPRRRTSDRGARSSDQRPGLLGLGLRRRTASSLTPSVSQRRRRSATSGRSRRARHGRARGRALVEQLPGGVTVVAVPDLPQRQARRGAARRAAERPQELQAGDRRAARRPAHRRADRGRASRS